MIPASNWLRSALARRVRYRITRGGVLFTLTILGVMLGAVFSSNNLLFLIAAAMMATLLVSGLVSRLCLAGLELDFVVPEHVAAGRAVPGRLMVRNQKWLMPSFSIRVEGVREAKPSAGGPIGRAAGGSLGGPLFESDVYFPLIAGGATVEETVEVRFPRRGTYRENGFAFSTGFPFGFLEKSARVTLRRETVVYPPIHPQPGFEDLLLGIAGEIETHYRGLGKDFYRIRPYEVLESARHVDWKATAHVGSLQVREFAREQERRVEIFLDRDVPAALDAWFEHAIDCCAFLAWRLSSEDASIQFRSNGYSFRQPEEGDIYTILKYLALVYPQTASAAEGPIEESSYKLVFSASPQKFIQAGWMDARILSPENLPL